MSYKHPLGSGMETQCLLYQRRPNFMNATESRSYFFELFTRFAEAETAAFTTTELAYRERRPPAADNEQIADIEMANPAVGAKLRAWAAEESVAAVDPEKAAEIFRLLENTSIPTLWPAEESICDGSRHSLSIRRGDTQVSVSWYSIPDEYARIESLIRKIIELAVGYYIP